MNRIIKFLLGVFLIIVAIVFFTKPVILLIAKRQLCDFFKTDEVYIGGCNLKPATELSFLDIKVKRGKILELKIKEAILNYSIPQVFKSGISGFYLKGISLNCLGLYLENAYLKASSQEQQDGFFIPQVTFNKLKLEEIKSKTRLDGKTLFLDSLTAKILDGGLQAGLKLTMDNNPQYNADMNFLNLNLATFVKDLNLEEKVQMSGRLSGKVVLEGKGPDVKVLSGDFSTSSEGGRLAIKDTALLENMASNSQLPVDKFVETFQNFHYNKGIMTLSLDKGNVILDAALDGESGKCNLTVNVHDLFK
jgi:hypothetical protein